MSSEQPVSINININLSELPSCKCGTGALLPIMDIAKEGVVPILKGWFCNNCNRVVMFKAGSIVEEKIVGER